MNKQKYILSIAGFDPSSGAGLSSDIKTFHTHNLYGLSVCTGVTVQNDISFRKSYWIETEIILEQINTLFERFKINVVKIGIIKNWQVLNVVLDQLKILNPTIKIILDPVLKASDGFKIHLDNFSIDTILEKVDLLTPNYEEIQNLYPEKSIKETITYISKKTNLYLKGGHKTENTGLDQLWLKSKNHIDIAPNEINFSPKHGSGCVLSSAIASNIALGHNLKEAAELGKRYTEQFLSSNSGLLGIHKMIHNAI